jgi:hypothetical protein
MEFRLSGKIVHENSTEYIEYKIRTKLVIKIQLAEFC